MLIAKGNKFKTCSLYKDRTKQSASCNADSFLPVHMLKLEVRTIQINNSEQIQVLLFVRVECNIYPIYR